MEKEPVDESLQGTAAQAPNLRGSDVAPLVRTFSYRAAGALPKKALRVVTGQLKSASVETLRQEAGNYSIVTASKRATALA